MCLGRTSVNQSDWIIMWNTNVNGNSWINVLSVYGIYLGSVRMLKLLATSGTDFGKRDQLSSHWCHFLLTPWGSHQSQMVGMTAMPFLERRYWSLSHRWRLVILLKWQVYIETIYNQEIDSIITYKFGFLFHTFHLKYMYMDMNSMLSRKRFHGHIINKLSMCSLEAISPGQIM